MRLEATRRSVAPTRPSPEHRAVAGWVRFADNAARSSIRRVDTSCSCGAGPSQASLAVPVSNDSVPESAGNRKLEQIFFLD
jgi:hypothetical protein